MDKTKRKYIDSMGYLVNNYKDDEDTMDSLCGLEQVVHTLQSKLDRIELKVNMYKGSTARPNPCIDFIYNIVNEKK